MRRQGSLLRLAATNRSTPDATWAAMIPGELGCECEYELPRLGLWGGALSVVTLLCRAGVKIGRAHGRTVPLSTMDRKWLRLECTYHTMNKLRTVRTSSIQGKRDRFSWSYTELL
ncbi:hypothetical protein SEVIR_7G096900v4 [Setaria viridis]|uniref:Uncharacterized protein n=1 Tax=Setaria viridis TaxID=4556 RepID=A0A4U6TND4_SETVI|nr:hypothetical protein SEVIR_7G096900v2 [Setaria viridis]